MKTYKHDLMGNMMKLKNGKVDFVKPASPFTHHRHTEARYNYIERNNDHME